MKTDGRTQKAQETTQKAQKAQKDSKPNFEFLFCAFCVFSASSASGSPYQRAAPAGATRQMTLPTSSATSSAPLESSATPTGRP